MRTIYITNRMGKHLLNKKQHDYIYFNRTIAINGRKTQEQYVRRKFLCKFS